jgi:hypothetical protein
VNLELVTLVSSMAEVEMLFANLIDRKPDIPLTVLVRSGVRLPRVDPELVHVVPIDACGLVEEAMADYAIHARRPWLLQVDPDEFWSDEAFGRALELAKTLAESEAAAFRMTYFVGPQPLRGGPWSGIYQQRLNSATSFSRSIAEVHIPPPASRVDRVVLTTPVKHYWVSDLAELRAKHEIYLGREGSARMAKFGQYNVRKSTIRIGRTIGRCLRSAPWKDGVLGLRLAAEMIRYERKANAAWREEHRRISTASVRHGPGV